MYCYYCRTSEHAGKDCLEVDNFEQDCLHYYILDPEYMLDLETYFNDCYERPQGFFVIQNYGDKYGCPHYPGQRRHEIRQFDILEKLKQRLQMLILDIV